MTSTECRAQVLIIEDDPDFQYALGVILNKCNCVVYKSDSYTDAKDALQQNTFDIVFCDLRLPGSKPGKQILSELKQCYPSIHFIMMSAHVDDETLCELLESGATDVIQKPFYLEYCASLIDSLIYAHEEDKAA